MADDTREAVVGVIGGSGVYQIDGLENTRWETVPSPFGEPSDQLLFGELDGRLSERAVAFRDACREAGFEAEVSPDIRATLWDKFVLLATNAGLTTLLRKPAGEVYTDPEILDLAMAMMREVVAVASAEGVRTSPDIVDRSIALSKSFPPGMYASMYHDLARGRRLEVASLSGLVARRGKALGVPVPHHTTVWCALKPYVDGA
jgi:2-dehydropantoate 2-reductase